MGSIANVEPHIVQLLSCRTTVGVALGLISKSLRAIAGIVLSQSTVASAHVGSDVPIRQPLQKLPVPVGRVGRPRFWFSSLPLRETGKHVLGGHRLLTHACCGGLHSHDHATMVVDQIVVVVSQPSRRAALSGVSRIGIGGRYLLLLVNRFFRSEEHTSEL